MGKVFDYFKNGNIVILIVVGMLLGIGLALISKEYALSVGVLGDLFVGALKAIAPILIFVLVIAAIATKPLNVETRIKPILLMYIVGTLLASIVAVFASFIFPTELIIAGSRDISDAPQGLLDVVKSILFKMVDNPINALASANYIGVIAWSVGIGLALHHGSSAATKELLKDVNDSALKLARFIIRLAPFGIFGIMAHTFANEGVDSLIKYGHLLIVLVGTMIFVCFVVNAIIIFAATRKNPFPLILTCLEHSGVTAFFTRSSAANVPVNLALCEKMGLDKNTYNVSIPLGATINMAGAAVTITVFALAAANTFGIEVDMGSAILLCIVSTFAACGASGVASGSLLLIPLACSLLNINDDIAMKVVAIGFIVGVVQDSVETALNSSTDVMFTAAASKTPPNLDF